MLAAVQTKPFSWNSPEQEDQYFVFYEDFSYFAILVISDLVNVIIDIRKYISVIGHG